MLASPFAFYRGAAALMAADLDGTPDSGLRVQACGDAHLSNFGGFAAPDRHLVFDINDFDETLPGPWEWDVKRLVASLEIAARERGMNRKERERIVRGSVGAYRQAMTDFAGLSNLDVFYARMDRERIVALASRIGREDMIEQLERNTQKARKKNSLRALRKLTKVEDGRRRFDSAPPLLVPVHELAPEGEADDLEQGLRVLIVRYAETLRDEVRQLLARYEFIDLARKVVGVGSVGTQAWVVLLVGRDEGDPLLLQVKEAEPSVLERFLPPSEFENHGRRVVEGQRLIQGASDLMLGWIRNEEGLDGQVRDFYVRQLWDWKQSADIETMGREELEIYGGLCGWTLARAHARSGDGVAIAAYLGKSDRFDRALVPFAAAYADQNERDHSAFVDAIKAGKLEAESGV